MLYIVLVYCGLARNPMPAASGCDTTGMIHVDYQRLWMLLNKLFGVEMAPRRSINNYDSLDTRHDVCCQFHCQF